MDWLEAVGDQALRATFTYVLARPRPVTADELAASQRIHRNVARTRLERLAEAGLLRRGFERRSGRTGPGAGRPAKTYAVVPQLRTIQFPDRRYEKLLALIVDSLPKRARLERLRALGASFADELLRAARLRPAKTLQVGAERICATLRELGFHAVLTEASDSVAVIETAACPLRPLVREHGDVGEIDRGMWIALAARALEGVEPAALDCGTHACNDDGCCRVTLTLEGSPRTPARRRS